MTVPPDAYETAAMVAGHIRRARIRLGLSLEELANESNVCQSTMQSLEHARKPIFVSRGKVRGYTDRTLQRIETALGWGWGTFYDLIEGKIDEPWLLKEPREVPAGRMVPEVITLDWLMSMILQYKFQGDTNGES